MIIVIIHLCANLSTFWTELWIRLDLRHRLWQSELPLGAWTPSIEKGPFTETETNLDCSDLSELLFLPIEHSADQILLILILDKEDLQISAFLSECLAQAASIVCVQACAVWRQV